jgi:mannitol 2-dehydrogenase
VFCEPFRQWVIEDHFPAGRPPLEQAGVTFVSDVSAHELMKIRMLNGGHAAMAYPAALLDIEFVHTATAHPLVRGFLERVEREEIIPHVPVVPEITREGYLGLLLSRFLNPSVRDTTRRLAEDGFNRQPKFIVPSVRDGLATGAPVGGLALASALWCRYCTGVTESGAGIAPNDSQWDALKARAAAAHDDPGAWLAMGEVYGDLGQNPRFAAAFGGALRSLATRGVADTLADYANNSEPPARRR